MCTLMRFLYFMHSWIFFFYPSLLLSWMFEHDCMDTCCFGVSYMHVFCIFVFAFVLHMGGRLP